MVAEREPGKAPRLRSESAAVQLGHKKWVDFIPGDMIWKNHKKSPQQWEPKLKAQTLLLEEETSMHNPSVSWMFKNTHKLYKDRR